MCECVRVERGEEVVWEERRNGRVVRGWLRVAVKLRIKRSSCQAKFASGCFPTDGFCGWSLYHHHRHHPHHRPHHHHYHHNHHHHHHHHHHH